MADKPTSPEPGQPSTPKSAGIRPKGLKLNTAPPPRATLPKVLDDKTSLGKITINGQEHACVKKNLEQISNLGDGAYGFVYKMRHKDLNLEMAVKQMRYDESRTATLTTDLEIIRKCKCPYIVSYYGYNFEESEVWIYMELALGSLDKIYETVKSRSQIFPEDILRKIAFSVLQGLHYLKSEHRVMYRDVKPSNILLATDGSIKLCDFGISKVMAEAASYSKSLVGSERYLPPERLDPKRSKEEYDVRSDVWAYGLTLIELATLKYPYPDKMYERMQAVVVGEPPKIPVERYSAELAEFVAYCLQKIPENRPKYDHAPEAFPTQPSLIKHPYILHAGTIGINVAEWYHSIL
eukprot:m.93469 g.93469  ORF g.93469 m.93469 type:complete len:351 (+) comp15374_c0_seq2:1193-2245(+)